MLLHENFLDFKSYFFLFLLLHLVHIGGVGVHDVVAVHVDRESTLLDLPKVRNLEGIPAVGPRLIRDSLLVFLSCNN